MLSANKPLMLNLGCGTRTHDAWINIDFSLKAILRDLFFVRPFISTQNPVGYMNHDLRRGIPFPNGVVDVVYASHVLEHLVRKEALSFMKEIHRVLKPNGIIRIVVPDLEKAVITYLNALHTLRSDNTDSQENKDQHEWATIMLVDQMVRTQPGGEMASWLREHRQSKIVQSMEGIFLDIANSDNSFEGRRGLKARVINILRPKDPAKNGELHRWMYDDISLGHLFTQAGFKDVQRMSHLRSRISEWTNYYLDNNEDSSPHQPNSIWMEAVK
ncbi:MAG: methyltransferase domain-containing protein [Sedimentisphaerales bacterium]|nr:methyltransferase domain-containing protein [Sedimentisphaerales bacterium]